jgi:hypothetical protein
MARCVTLRFRGTPEIDFFDRPVLRGGLMHTVFSREPVSCLFLNKESG